MIERNTVAPQLNTYFLALFERCCQFIKQGVEQGGILVHFYELGSAGLSSGVGGGGGGLAQLDPGEWRIL